MERKYYLRGLGVGIVVTAVIMGFALSGDRTMSDAEIMARAKKLGMVENKVLSDLDNENAGDEPEEEETDGQNSQDQFQDVSKDGQGVAEQTGESANTTETDEDEQPAETAKDTDTIEADGTDSETEDVSDVLADRAEDGDDETGDKQTVATGETGAKTSADVVGGQDAAEPEDTNGIMSSATIKTITVSSGDGSYTVARKLADVGVVTSAESFDTYLCQNGYDKKLRTGTFSIPSDASDEQIARIVTGAE